jgi:C4-type Zn-finger protein
MNLAYAVENYVRTGGNNCPICGSAELGGEERENVGAVITQQVVCNSCGSEWTDTYVLQGAEITKVKNEPGGQ